MKMFKLAASIAALCLACSGADASTEAGSHITSYTPQVSGRMFFTTDGQRSNLPSCATASNRWVIDTTTPAGQAVVAGMLTAYAQHRTLTLVGTGDCSEWGDTETVVFFNVT